VYMFVLVLRCWVEAEPHSPTAVAALHTDHT
jgi:hypothetical protein